MIVPILGNLFYKNSILECFQILYFVHSNLLQQLSLS